MYQATLGNMPVLNVAGFGSLPAVEFTAASTHTLLSSATVTQAQPITVSMVYNKSGTGTCDMILNGGSSRGRQ